MFLETKTLFYNVDKFLFYILTEWTDTGATMIGYFSKEKRSSLNYNLSCILIFSHCRRRGYGQFLIDFSYLLSRKEGKIGTPEKPLSDLGLVAYRKYWSSVIMGHLDTHEDGTFSIESMSQESGVSAHDLISTLQSLGMIKYWRGKHVLVPRADLLAAYHATEQRKALRLAPRKLRWAPHFAKWN
jgi:histone acetyltransferase MYST2